jgi:pimeloyl-ACP methyl ester carboxylesterase
MGPRFLYLHGFASGRDSHKGVALAQHFDAAGVQLERLDLRVPSLEKLLFSAILETVERAIGGPRERVVLIGSSLGGLAACRTAERDARVCAVVALAPAFRLGERWRRQLGEAAWADWRARGFRETWDYAEKRPAQVHFGFVEDLAPLDEGWPDVRVPTLIVHGQRDDTVDIELSREFARGRRHVRLVERDDDHQLVASLPVIAAECDRFLAPFLGA